MNKKIRIGFIGFGYWTPILFRNIKKFPDAEVVAFCEKDTSKHQKLSEMIPDVKIYEHYRDMFANPDIDAVVVGASVSAHFRIARMALENKKHVLIEKPMTTSTKEAKILVDLADQTGKVLMVDHTYIYSPAIQKLQEIVQSGEIGEPYYFDSVRGNIGIFQWDTSVLWDLAPHDFSILLYLIKEKPTHVAAFGGKPVAHPRQQGPIESFMYITVHFASGLIAHFHISWMWPIKTRRVTVVGSKKMADYDQMDPEARVKVYDKSVAPRDPDPENPTLYPALFEYRDEGVSKPEMPEGEDLEFVIKDFLTSIQENKKPLSDGRFGLEVVRLLSAADRSLQKGGKRIKI